MADRALLAIRRENPHLADGLQRVCQDFQLARLNAIVIGYEDSGFCHDKLPRMAVTYKNAPRKLSYTTRRPMESNRYAHIAPVFRSLVGWK